MGFRCLTCGGRGGGMRGWGPEPRLYLGRVSKELLSLGRALTSVLGLAQPHLSDLPTPGLQLRVPSHDVIPAVEKVDDPLHVPAQGRREVSSLRGESFGL